MVNVSSEEGLLCLQREAKSRAMIEATRELYLGVKFLG